jgi:hypothetical protein
LWISREGDKRGDEERSCGLNEESELLNETSNKIESSWSIENSAEKAFESIDELSRSRIDNSFIKLE